MVGWAGLTCVHCSTRNRHLVRAGSVAQGTLLDPWWPRREENPEGRGHVCTCGWFTSLYSRNQHNTVEELSLPPQQRRQGPEAVTDSTQETEKAGNTVAGASEEQNPAKMESSYSAEAGMGCKKRQPRLLRGVYLGFGKQADSRLKGCERW